MLPSVIGLIILMLLSLPIVSGQLIKFLEQSYTPTNPNEITSADTVIVLSGMVTPIEHDNGVLYEFSDAVDRIFAGISLLKLGKAQQIILTRGELPASKGVPEGEFLAEFIQSQGIDPNRILLTEIVQNTTMKLKLFPECFPKIVKLF